MIKFKKLNLIVLGVTLFITFTYLKIYRYQDFDETRASMQVRKMNGNFEANSSKRHLVVVDYEVSFLVTILNFVFERFYFEEFAYERETHKKIPLFPRFR